MRSQFDMKLKIYGYTGLDKSQLSKKSVIETRELIRGLELPDTSSITDTSINPKNVTKHSKRIISTLLPDLNSLETEISYTELSIPMYYVMNDEDISYIIDIINKF